MAIAPTQTQLSLETFLDLPETKPANEYIDGCLYPKPMPQGKHSTLQSRLVASVNQIAIPQRLAHGFTELRCTFAGRSLVPDISVFTWEQIPLDDGGEIQNVFDLAPNWTIEILSPDQSPTRVINNILFCLNHGTALGWFIDPQEKNVLAFRPGQQPVAYDQAAEVLPVLQVLSDWQLTVEELFSWLNFPR